jgi:hypothetical protein
VAKLSGSYDLPFGVTVAGFFNARDGVPFVRSILAETRGNGLADVEVQIDPYGDSRYDDLYTVDLRASKSFAVYAKHRLSVYADVFNVTNANTVLTRQDQQQLLTANDVLEILAPRLMRVGVKYTF